jgi:hypothetical protein
MRQKFVTTKEVSPPWISKPWRVMLVGEEGPFRKHVCFIEWFTTKKAAETYAESMNLVISHWKK